ncbi:hypothetical protein [Sphingomonas sp. Mn802worker]|uniref:hypothetical protein n=1 Tax=Sphingomonas sp. Mn802worker TaxID=629773 RepID=UPI0012EA74E0|nr:hypothetical protein [Sphingomonas sp. Mn802worker]
MPQITGQLFEGKPIVSVAVSEGAPIPSAVGPQHQPPSFHIREYRALLDTGADITCVLPHVAKECFLVPRGLIPMTNGVGTYHHVSYLINVGVFCENSVYVNDEIEVERSLYWIPEANIAAEIKANSWFDMIIGMDIISQHELSFLKGGQFRFTLS